MANFYFSKMMPNVGKGVGKGTFSYIAGDGVNWNFSGIHTYQNLENAHSKLLLLNIILKVK